MWSSLTAPAASGGQRSIVLLSLLLNLYLQDLAAVFGKFGELHSSPFFPAAREGMHPFGFANFEWGEDAQRALEQLDRQVLYQNRCCCAGVFETSRCIGRQRGIVTPKMG